MNVLKAVAQGLGIVRGRVRDWCEWATANPAAAVTYCEVSLNVLDHRIVILEGKRIGFFLRRRLRGLRSARAQVVDLRQYFQRLASEQDTNPIDIR